MGGELTKDCHTVEQQTGDCPVSYIKVRSEAELNVVGVPLNNVVYVHPAQMEFFKPFAKVNYIQVGDGAVFPVKSDAAVKLGNISLTKLQQECAKSPESMRVECKRWKPLHKVVTASFEVVDVLRSTKEEGQLIIKEDELMPILKANFRAQALKKGQLFCVDFQGASLHLAVKSFSTLATPSPVFGEEEKEIAIAVVSPETEFEIDVAPTTKRLTLEKSVSRPLLPRPITADELLQKNLAVLRTLQFGPNVQRKVIFRDGLLAQINGLSADDDLLEYPGLKEIVLEESQFDKENNSDEALVRRFADEPPPNVNQLNLQVVETLKSISDECLYPVGVLVCCGVITDIGKLSPLLRLFRKKRGKYDIFGCSTCQSIDERAYNPDGLRCCY